MRNTSVSSHKDNQRGTGLFQRFDLFHRWFIEHEKISADQRCFRADQFWFSLNQSYSELKNSALSNAEERCFRENQLWINAVQLKIFLALKHLIFSAEQRWFSADWFWINCDNYTVRWKFQKVITKSKVMKMHRVVIKMAILVFKNGVFSNFLQNDNQNSIFSKKSWMFILLNGKMFQKSEPYQFCYWSSVRKTPKFSLFLLNFPPILYFGLKNKIFRLKTEVPSNNFPKKKQKKINRRN